VTERGAEEIVAYALEMDLELLPYASELLSDLDVFGADTAMIVAALAALELGPATVVDLGTMPQEAFKSSPRSDACPANIFGHEATLEADLAA
jgi:hypothetical protein